MSTSGITFELAVELKKAGCPYVRLGEYFEHRVGSHSDDHGGDSDYPCYCNQDKMPSLSELIEWCGRRDFGLRCTYSARENATFYVIEIPGTDDMERCSTPEEAVARLALQIHRKQKDLYSKDSIDLNASDLLLTEES